MASSSSLIASRHFSSSPASAFAASSATRAIWPLGKGDSKPESTGEVLKDNAASTSESLKESAASTTEQLKDGAASSAEHLQSVADSAAASASSVDLSSAVDSTKEAASSVIDAITQEVVRNFSEVTLSWWPNVRITELGLDWLVETTGAPWWAIIMGVTLSVRVLLFPFAAKGQAQSMRLAIHNPKLQELMADVQDASRRRDAFAQQESTMKVQKFMKDNDLRPFAAFKLPLVQMPIFMSFFFALRALAEQNLDTMKAGGLSWFPDLTMADPTVWTLPILSSVCTLAVMETGAEMGATPASNEGPQKYTRWVMRGVFVALPFFVKNLPAAVFVYWITSAALSMVQLAILQIPALRRYYDLPERKKLAEAAAAAKAKTLSSTRDRRKMSFAEAVSAGYQSQQPVENFLAAPGGKAASPLSKQENAYEKWFAASKAQQQQQQSGSLFEEGEGGQASSSSSQAASSPLPADNTMSMAAMRRELRRKQDEAEAKKQRAAATKERRNNRRRY